jgi:hypothetical protein
MATVNSIQMAVTTEGLESIAAMIAEGTTFTISTFRLSDLGNETFFEAQKSYTGLDPDSFYMPYTADDFDDNDKDPVINAQVYAAGLADSNGFITINTIELADPITVEINCYIPPAVGTSFPCNEIMVYTGSGTLADPYKSFIWGIFPEITKQEQYGINFRVLLQF